MARRVLSRTDFVKAGTELVDRHGASALTARALGEAMGVDGSALYRHFTGLDELAAEIVDQVLLEILDLPLPAGSPRDRLRAHMLAVHRVLSSRPNIVGLIPSLGGTTPQGDRMFRLALDLLRALGLEGETLVVCHQMLESAVLGSHLFDFGGSPQHLEVRRQRYRRVEDADIDDWSRSIDDIEHINESAYALMVESLVERCVAMAAMQSSHPG